MVVERIGAYRVTGELGRGGMGVVYAAQGPDGREVAVKVLAEGSPSPTLIARFEREARACAALSHPSVVKHLDSGRVHGRPYLVFELLQGDSLETRLSAHGPLPPAEAAELVAILARAVAHLHTQGLLHRDLKPENVLFHHGQAKLTDLGLARDARAERERLTQTGEVLGTPAYMSPEQASGDSVGIATDLYGLGAILYATLCGRAPYRGATAINILSQLFKGPPKPPSAYASVPATLEAICMRAMSRDPADRYEGASEVAEALEAWLATPRAKPRPGRRALIAPALGLGGVVLSGLLLIAAAGPDAQAPSPERSEAPTSAPEEPAPNEARIDADVPATEPAIERQLPDPLVAARSAFDEREWELALAELDALDAEAREAYPALRLRGQVCLRLETYRGLPEFLIQAHTALTKAVTLKRDASTVALLALCRQPGWNEQSELAARLGGGRDPIALTAESMRLRVDMLSARQAQQAERVARLNVTRVALLRQALALDPRCFWARHQLPLAISGQRHDLGADREACIQEALDAAREGVEALPGVPMVHHRLGFVSKVAAQDRSDGAGYALAIPHYDRALELDPDYVAARVARGYALARARLGNGALDVERALEVSPYHRRALEVLDSILKAKNDLQNAEATWTRLIERTPNDFQRYVYRHEVWIARNDLGRAIADLETARALCPPDLPQHARLGRLLTVLRGER